MLPATGSTKMAAISPPCFSNIDFTESRSLYSATRVQAASSGITPGESGAPWVRAPDPAFTRNESP
jgi:hypothetical protein